MKKNTTEKETTYTRVELFLGTFTHVIFRMLWKSVIIKERITRV